MDSTVDEYTEFLTKKGLNKRTMDIDLFEATIEFIESIKKVNIDLVNIKDCGTCKHKKVSKYVEPCYGCRENDGYDNYSSAIGA